MQIQFDSLTAPFAPIRKFEGCEVGRLGFEDLQLIYRARTTPADIRFAARSEIGRRYAAIRRPPVSVWREF
jgi:hypothetical protein